MNEHRIQQTSIALTVQRQTPRDEFGSHLASALSSAVGAIAPVVPVLSAAVTGVSAGAGLVKALGGSGGSSYSRGQVTAVNATTSAGATGQSPTAASGTSASSETAGLDGGQWDLVNAQKQMNTESQTFNMEYLSLQDSMQKESREYTAITNIMKVRHDSAKAAINNIH